MTEQTQTDQANDTPAGTETEGDVDKMFAEAVAERSGEHGQGGAGDASALTAEPSATDGKGGEGSDSVAGGAGEAKEGAGAKDGGKPDPWAGVSPEAKKLYDDAVQAVRTTSGRLRSVQGELNELKRAAPKPGPATQQDGAAAKPDIGEALRKIREDYPDFAPVLDVVEEARQAIQTTTTTVGTLAEDHYDRQAQEQIGLLKQRHPDWLEVYNSPELATWKAANSKMAEILDTTESGDEIAQVLDLFKLQTSRATAPAGDDPDPEPDPKPVTGLRAAQLETAYSPQGRSASAPAGNGGAADPEEALFKQIVEQRRAKRDRA